MPQDVEEHNKKVLDTLEIGDLIEVIGRIYSHWAVFIGPFVKEDGSYGDYGIVHLSGVDRCGTAADSSSSHVFTIAGIGYDNASVIVEDFWNVAEHNKVKKNNDKDKIKGYNPSSAEKIVERALKKKGVASYRLLWYNCEHFASWCRYGKLKSQQADTALTCGVALGAVVVIGGVANEAITGGKHIRGAIELLKSGPSSSRATNFEDFTAGGPNGIPNQAKYATSWSDMALGVLSCVGKLCYEAYTGGNDRRGRIASSRATNFEDFTAGGPNGIPNQAKYSTSWSDMAPGALVDVGKLCYDAYTGGNDRRSFPGGALSSIDPTSYSADTQSTDYLSFLQRNRMLQTDRSFLNMGIQTGTYGILNFQKR